MYRDTCSIKGRDICSMNAIELANEMKERGVDSQTIIKFRAPESAGDFDFKGYYITIYDVLSLSNEKLNPGGSFIGGQASSLWPENVMTFVRQLAKGSFVDKFHAWVLHNWKEANQLLWRSLASIYIEHLQEEMKKVAIVSNHLSEHRIYTDPDNPSVEEVTRYVTATAVTVSQSRKSRDVDGPSLRGSRDYLWFDGAFIDHDLARNPSLLELVKADARASDPVLKGLRIIVETSPEKAKQGVMLTIPGGRMTITIATLIEELAKGTVDGSLFREAIIKLGVETLRSNVLVAPEIEPVKIYIKREEEGNSTE